MRARDARMRDLQPREEKERQIGDGITRKAQWEDNGRIRFRFAPPEGANDVRLREPALKAGKWVERYRDWNVEERRAPSYDSLSGSKWSTLGKHA